MIIFLADCIATPAKLLRSSTDAFNDPLLPCTVLQSLREQPSELFNDIVIAVCRSIKDKVSAQLTSYRTGDLAQTDQLKDQALLEKTRSAPAHNMYAERALGMVDSHKRRAPNATIGFIDAKVRSKLNKTMSCLTAMSVEEQDSRVKFAVAEGSKLRHGHKVKKEKLHQDILIRSKVKTQENENSEMNRMDREFKRVFEDGGELDYLKERISDQFTFECVRKIYNFDGVGLKFTQGWAEKDGTIVMYDGVIDKIGTKKKIRGKDLKLVILFTPDGEQSTDVEQHNSTFLKFATSVMAGDVVFEKV